MRPGNAMLSIFLLGSLGCLSAATTVAEILPIESTGAH
jgi:hypothetical protein